jgi:hypothetical protein
MKTGGIAFTKGRTYTEVRRDIYPDYIDVVLLDNDDVPHPMDLNDDMKIYFKKEE